MGYISCSTATRIIVGNDEEPGLVHCIFSVNTDSADGYQNYDKFFDITCSRFSY